MDAQVPDFDARKWKKYNFFSDVSLEQIAFFGCDLDVMFLFFYLHQKNICWKIDAQSRWMPRLQILGFRDNLPGTVHVVFDSLERGMRPKQNTTRKKTINYQLSNFETDANFITPPENLTWLAGKSTITSRGIHLTFMLGFPATHSFLGRLGGGEAAERGKTQFGVFGWRYTQIHRLQ